MRKSLIKLDHVVNKKTIKIDWNTSSTDIITILVAIIFEAIIDLAETYILGYSG